MVSMTWPETYMNGVRIGGMKISTGARRVEKITLFAILGALREKL